LIDTIEEKQQTIEHLGAVIDQYKEEVNLLTNKLQYANIEIKQNKTKLFQKDKGTRELSEQVRDLECSLKKSRAEVAEGKRRLALSEACRSNTTQQLSRCREENQHLQEAGAGGSVRCRKSNSSAALHQSSRRRRVKDENTHNNSTRSNSSDHEELGYLDMSGGSADIEGVRAKRRLQALAGQIARWNQDGILPDMEGRGDWLEHVCAQLNDVISHM
jgi:hypothetical protein